MQYFSPLLPVKILILKCLFRALIVTVDTDMNTTLKYYGVNGQKGANFIQTSPIKDYSTSNLALHLRDRVQEAAIDDANRKVWSVGYI